MFVEKPTFFVLFRCTVALCCWRYYLHFSRFSIIFHIPYSQSFTSLRKWAKCLHMRTRININMCIRRTINPNTFTLDFFSSFFQSIYSPPARLFFLFSTNSSRCLHACSCWNISCCYIEWIHLKQTQPNGNKKVIKRENKVEHNFQEMTSKFDIFWSWELPKQFNL